MLELNENDSLIFIRLLYWIVKFNSLLEKLKEEYLNLDPLEFETENDYVIYSNILKRINNNIFLIKTVMNSLAFTYSPIIDTASVGYKQIEEHINSITTTNYINKDHNILAGQWNCIINELLYFLESI